MDKYFTGKIRCVEAKTPLFTKGKIYEVNQGRVYHNNGFITQRKCKTLEAINEYLDSKFELVEEPDFQKSLEHIENVIEEFSYLEEKTNKQKLQEIISYFGEDNQKLKAIEELSELTIAIINAKNDKTENLIEEIADVEIMIKQLKMIYKIDKFEIKRMKEFKIERTLKMIEEA